MMNEKSLLNLSKAIWCCLSFAIASIAAGLLISLIVVVRLTIPEASVLSAVPLGSLVVLSQLTILLFREAERNRKWFIQIWDRIREDLRERQAMRLVELIEDGCTRDTARLQLALSLTSSRSLLQTRT